MIRPDDVPDFETLATGWVQLIEQELLRAWPAGHPWPQQGSEYYPPARLRIDRALPKDLIDAIDDALRARGWRLHRPVHEYTGELQSPVQSYGRERAFSQWFEVEADRACRHRYVRPYGASASFVGFCKWCGAKPEPGDYVDDANTRRGW